jgi:Clr5 domain
MSGRNPINLEPYRQEIEDLYNNNNNTIDYVISQLQVRHGLQVKATTLKDRLRKWGIRQKNPTVASDEALHARIKVLFFQAGLDDKDLHRVLQEEGYRITRSTLKRLRRKLGLYRRVANQAMAQQQVEEVLKKLEEEFEKGTIEGYGKNLLHRHFQSEVGLVVARSVILFIPTSILQI